MITTVTYQRLFNLGNYENLTLSATATVEDGDVQAAWDEARATVEGQHRAFLAEREAKERRMREAYEQERAGQQSLL